MKTVKSRSVREAPPEGLLEKYRENKITSCPVCGKYVSSSGEETKPYPRYYYKHKRVAGPQRSWHGFTETTYCYILKKD